MSTSNLVSHKITMVYKKSTPNTHVFESPDTFIPSVYIRKGAFPGKTPDKIFLIFGELSPSENMTDENT